jgi:sec-independent protein translocase protein TatA
MPTPGPLELVIILVIALLILGPGKLPDVGAALGKSIREFRKASSDVQDAVKVNVDTSPLPAPSSAVPAVPSPPPAAAPTEPGEPVASGSTGDPNPVTK